MCSIYLSFFRLSSIAIELKVDEQRALRLRLQIDTFCTVTPILGTENICLKLSSYVCKIFKLSSYGNYTIVVVLRQVIEGNICATELKLFFLNAAFSVANASGRKVKKAENFCEKEMVVMSSPSVSQSE